MVVVCWLLVVSCCLLLEFGCGCLLVCVVRRCLMAFSLLFHVVGVHFLLFVVCYVLFVRCLLFVVCCCFVTVVVVRCVI